MLYDLQLVLVLILHISAFTFRLQPIGHIGKLIYFLYSEINVLNMYINMWLICFFFVAGENLYTIYFIYKHKSVKVTESDLIHLRVWGGQSVNSSVASLAVFILDELQPLLIRRLRTQLLRRRHSRSPHLIGQLVTVGKKQLGKEAIKWDVWMVQSPLTCMTGSA